MTAVQTLLTPTVERIAAAAMAAGLAPRTQVEVYRGRRELYFDAHSGPDSPFGAVRIGARTGRVLSGYIRHGIDGTTERFTDGRAMVRALRALDAVF